jgi:hypothetical protein
MSWLPTVVASLLAVAFTYQLTSFLRLRHVPGPWWAAWTPFWLVLTQLTGRMHFILHDVTKRYGKSVGRSTSN